MAHFAKVLDGVVTEVIVAEQNYIDTLEGQWVQTSYNTYGNQHPNGTPLRGNYAAVGYTYDLQNDVFYAPQPAPSCTLNTQTWSWEYPQPYPTDGKAYVWDEATTAWIKPAEEQQ
jgi:hypothetical protein